MLGTVIEINIVNPLPTANGSDERDEVRRLGIRNVDGHRKKYTGPETPHPTEALILVPRCYGGRSGISYSDYFVA